MKMRMRNNEMKTVRKDSNVIIKILSEYITENHDLEHVRLV